MIALLLILIPVFGGLAAFFIKKIKYVKTWTLLTSLITLGVSLYSLFTVNQPGIAAFSADWMPGLGTTFSIRLDGMGRLLCLLTAIAFPAIFSVIWKREFRNEHRFSGLMLLTQAGLMGVFLAMDALVFYFFWELALIPVYFLCSIWGGEKRIQATFKFFIYTFLGSVLMLAGLIYLQSNTAEKSFSISAFYDVHLSQGREYLVFLLMFLAFAIKIPVFPFHTWQPDTYEQAPTPVTMILSGVMVKMGVFAIIRWLIPVLPAASYAYGETTISILAVIGMLYASLIAMRQDNMKRLVAYSSIAHLGLMVIALFSESETGMQGVMIQMFSHGINIIGLWIIVEIIEQRYGTTRFSELGGLATRAPSMAILFLVIALANIALPLTNSFIGEFMMFTGIFTSPVFRYEYFLVPAAGICIILGAVYTLRMVQQVLYGEMNAVTEQGTDIPFNQQLVLWIMVILILFIGVYPEPFLELTRETTTMILKEADVSSLLGK